MRLNKIRIPILEAELDPNAYAAQISTTYARGTDPSPRILVLGKYISNRKNRCLAGITLKCVWKKYGKPGLEALRKHLPDILGYTETNKNTKILKAGEGRGEMAARPLKGTGSTTGRWEMGAKVIPDPLLNNIFDTCYRTWYLDSMGKGVANKFYAFKREIPGEEPLTPTEIQKTVQDLEKAIEKPEIIKEPELPPVTKDDYPTPEKSLTGEPSSVADEPETAPQQTDIKPPEDIKEPEVEPEEPKQEILKAKEAQKRQQEQETAKKIKRDIEQKEPDRDEIKRRAKEQVKQNLKAKDAGILKAKPPTPPEPEEPESDETRT